MPGSSRSVRRAAVLLAAMLPAVFAVAGCVNPQTAEFVTNQDVSLRLTQADESPVTAEVPRGTPVERLGWVGGECICWLVAAPQGVGWVYTRYLDLRLADSMPPPS